MIKIFSLLFFFTYFNTSYAASCCGGGSSSSLIMQGDNSQEYSLGLSYRNDLGQSDNDGFSSFNSSDITDRQGALNFQYQRQLSERFQGAFKSGLIQKDIVKQKRSEHKTGFADLEMQGTYEFLPEYTYSLLKPRGFIYSRFSIPLSRSLYDSNSPVFSDVRGSGLYSLSAGSFFVKHFSDLTLKLSLEGQYYFGKEFNDSKLKDYQKLIIPIGISYALPMPVSIGGGASWSYQTAKKFSGMNHSNAQSEYFWELNAFINWEISREDTLGVNYADSTLLGKNINSALYRSLSLTWTASTPL